MTRSARHTARIAPLTLASLLVMAQLGALLLIAPLAGAAPAVSSVTPATGLSNGDELVVIGGTGFKPGSTDATVTFGGVAGIVCTGLDTPHDACPATASSDTALQVITPARSTAGAVNVVVRDSTGAATTVTNGFTYTLANAPTVTAVGTNSGPTNGATIFTITGTNFHTGATKPTVNFGTTAGIVGAVACPTSTCTISVTTPVHAPGAVNLAVVNPDGQSTTVTNGFTFVASAVPTVSSVAPGNGASNGGTSLTITGTNFFNGATVLVGGVPATSVVVNSATSITAVTPPHAAGTVDVLVSNPDGQVVTKANSFTFLADAAPTLVSSPIAPTTGPTTGGTVFTITGDNFQSASTVTVGGAVARVVSVSLGASDVITAVAPAGTGSATVVVTNPDGQTVSKASAFTYQGPFILTSASPATGTANGGTVVTLTGQGIASGAKVSFDGGTTFVAGTGSGTTLTATTPGTPAATQDIVVRNPDGKTARLYNGFVFSAVTAPDIVSLDVTTGTENGGTAVVITGTGFFTGSVKPTVCLSLAADTDLDCADTDEQPGTVGTVTATTIAFVTTPRALGAGAMIVTVKNPSGQSDSLPAGFTYTDGTDPTITTPLATTSGTENGGTTFTITGTNFFVGTAKPTVTFGGVAATVGTVTATSIVVTTPAVPSTGVAVTVVVTNPGGDLDTEVLAYTFTDTTSPTVTSLSVTSGPTNGRTATVITGTNFHTASNALPRVCFSVATDADADCADANEHLATVTAVTATTITVTTPSAGAAGAMIVTVKNPGGDVGSLASAFTYTAGSSPTVTSLTPTSGINTVAPAIVTITGTNFGVTTVVKFGGVDATECTAVDTPVAGCTAPTATQVAVIPAGAAAGPAVTVAVENLDGLSGSLASAYRFLPSAPTLDATPLAPTSDFTNGGVTVTISGGGFDTTNKNTVLFGTTPSMDVTVGSTSSITAKAPAKTAGAATVSVLDSEGQSATTKDDTASVGKEDFTYVAALPPTITTLSTPAGPANGGNVVTITGTNFHTGSNAKPTVTFGGSFGTSVTVASASSLTVVVPGHAAGATTVIVTNPDGQTGSKTNGYTFVGTGGPPSPTVTSVAPNNGPAAGGTAVTITGTNFASGATVSFGSNACTSVTVVSGTSITCTTPAGTGAVSVSVTAGGQTGTLANAFTYDGATTTTTSTTTSTTSSTTTSTSTSSTSTSSGPTAPTAAQIQAANEDVKVTVERDGDDNLVKFDLPSGLPGTPQGVQIWRSNSPFVLVDSVSSSDPEFQDGEYRDADAAKDSKYLVTIYYGLTEALGFSSCTNTDQCTAAQLPPGFAALGDGSGVGDSGLGLGVILLIVAGVLVVVVVVVVIVVSRMRARGSAPQEPAEGYAWDDAAATAPAAAEPAVDAGEVHQCRCPSCQTSFSVTGAKPIVTKCPGCGKSGILR